MEYVWCPLKNGLQILPLSPEELTQGPQAEKMSFCVDSKDQLTENPARFVNGAASSEQCPLINIKMCELGRVMRWSQI